MTSLLSGHSWKIKTKEGEKQCSTRSDLTTFRSLLGVRVAISLYWSIDPK